MTDSAYAPSTQEGKDFAGFLSKNGFHDDDLVQYVDKRAIAQAKQKAVHDSPACTCNAASVPHYHGENGIYNA